jgi:preprotein translocase subunit SecA
MSGAVDRIFSGSADGRHFGAYRLRADAVSALERNLERLSGDALRARSEAFRQQLAAGRTRDGSKAKASADETNAPADEKGTPVCSAR